MGCTWDVQVLSRARDVTPHSRLGMAEWACHAIQIPHGPHTDLLSGGAVDERAIGYLGDEVNLKRASLQLNVRDFQ